MSKTVKIILITLIVLAMLGGAVFYIATTEKEKAAQEQMLADGNIYSGIKVQDIDLSGKSKEEAREILESYVNGILNKEFNIIIDNEKHVTSLQQLGLKFDYESALNDAYNFGRIGSKDARLSTINQIKQNPINFNINTSIYKKVLSDYIGKLNSSIIAEPVEPHIEYTNDSFKIIEGKNGVEIDSDKLVSDIVNAIKNGDDTVTAEARVKAPKNSSEMLKRINGVIGEFSTLLGSGTKGRNDNIKLSCKLISDRIVMPGQTISFNEEMGEINAQNGYKMASTIVGGKYVDSLGGGLCQTSTTLYNALVRADVEILERHPHSIAAPYVAVGADAAVWKGAKDLRFKNNWDFPILIKSWVDNKKIYFKIYGDVNKKDYDVDLKATITETIPAGRIEKESADIQSGEEKVISNGRSGQRAVSKKIYKKNGAIIKEVAYFNSYYPMQNRIVEVGIGAKSNNKSTDDSESDDEGPGTVDLFN